MYKLPAMSHPDFIRPIGARWDGESTHISVWSPGASQMAIILDKDDTNIPLSRDRFGYWNINTDKLLPEDRYWFEIDGKIKRPDPASRFQPNGVHGPSQIINPEFEWNDLEWKGLPMEQMIIYELHPGTFTHEGTFDGIIAKLKYLKLLGVNTIELMPVAQFPGSRNWGYDGVYPFAVQNSYGGPTGLKKLVNACHKMEMAVILDVVYNHLGPEGNYLGDYGPYFTDKYTTPWGKAINFDDAHSDPVRNYFIQNTLMWLEEYHIDGLRYDAIHAIYDFSAYHILRQISDEVEKLSKEQEKHYVLIAESDLNDQKVIASKPEGGYGMDGQWCDDIHHSIHALITGEEKGYYKDYGAIVHLEKALEKTFVYDGIYSEYRNKVFGNDASHLPYHQFIVFIQNHDQVGNRMMGDRLSTLVNFEKCKLAAAVIFLSPYVPMIFMGEEYGALNPFQYFVSHSDDNLIEAVRAGRQSEFSSFEWDGETPDPQSEATFERSKLNWNIEKSEKSIVMREWYKTLISLNKTHEALQNRSRAATNIMDDQYNDLITMHRMGEHKMIKAIFNFSDIAQTVTIDDATINYEKILDSAEPEWLGSGDKSKVTLSKGVHVGIPAHSVSVYESYIS